MKVGLKVIALVAVLIASSRARAGDNELTDQEKKEGWVLMFDGKTAKGWMSGTKPMPDKQVEDGTLNTKDQGAYVSHFDRKFSDFHFKCEYKFDKTCNSGIFVRISKPGDGGIGRGFEVQVIDSFGQPPTVHNCGALYLLKAPTKQMVKPAGEWNHCEIRCEGPLVKVWLNGEQIIDVNLDDWKEPNKNPDGTKHKFKWAFKDSPREGYIGLSFHDKNKNCWYRNLKVLDLKAGK